MKPQDLLDALKQARVYLEVRVDLAPPEALFEAPPGSTIQSIAAIYAHAVVTEDSFIHRNLQGLPPLYESAAWTSRLTFPPNVAIDREWAAGFRPDMPALREYARAVYAAGDAALSSASEESLSRQRDKYLAVYDDGRAGIERRQVPQWLVLMDDVVLHTAEHAGEIAALLGARGLKGSPWG